MSDRLTIKNEKDENNESVHSTYVLHNHTNVKVRMYKIEPKFSFNFKSTFTYVCRKYMKRFIFLFFSFYFESSFCFNTLAYYYWLYTYGTYIKKEHMFFLYFLFNFNRVPRVNRIYVNCSFFLACFLTTFVLSITDYNSSRRIHM